MALFAVHASVDIASVGDSCAGIVNANLDEENLNPSLEFTSGGAQLSCDLKNLGTASFAFRESATESLL